MKHTFLFFLLISSLTKFLFSQSITGIIIPGATVTNSGKNWDVTFYSSTNNSTAKENYKEIKIIQNNTKGEYLVFDEVSGGSNWEIVQGSPGSGSWFSFCKPMLENSNSCQNSTCTTSYYIRNLGSSTGQYTSEIRIGLSTATNQKSSSCTYDTSTAFKITARVKKVNSTKIYKWSEPSSGSDSSFSTASNWTPSRTSPDSSDILVFDLATGATTRNTTVYLDGVSDSFAQLSIAPYTNVTFKCSTSTNTGYLKIGKYNSESGTDLFVDSFAGLRFDQGTVTTRINSQNTSLFKSDIKIKSGTWIFDGAGTHVFNKNIEINGGNLKFQPQSGVNTLELRGKDSKLTGSGGTLYIDSMMNVKIGNGSTSSYTLENVLPLISRLTLLDNTTLKSNSPTNYNTSSNVNAFTPYLQIRTTNKVNTKAYGQIAEIPSSSSITGGALFEIYNDNQRSYRAIGLPFSTAIIVPQYTDDIDLTGNYSGSNKNEFTTTCSTCNSSIFRWNEKNSQWIAYTSGNTVTEIPQGRGTLVFFRGAKGNGLGDTTKSANSQILDFKGVLSQGNCAITLSDSGTSTYEGYNLISNPYPCTIDLREVYESNKNTIIPRFYMYDAITKAYNSWDSVGKNGNSPSYNGSNKYKNSSRTKTKLLAPGAAAFFILKNAGSSTTLTFSESHKFTGDYSATNHFNEIEKLPPDTCRELYVNMHFQDPNLPENDGFTLEFDQINQNDNFDIEDMPKIHAYLGIGTITDDNVWLAIDRRNKLATLESSKLIQLKTVYPSLEKMNLELSFDLCEGVESPYDIYLIDNITNQSILINDEVTYPFTVSTVDEKRSDRFQLLFSSRVQMNHDRFSQDNFIVYPNPNEGHFQIFNPKKNISLIKVLNNHGDTVFKKSIDHNKSEIGVDLSLMNSGVYHLLIQHKGGIYSQAIILL